MNKLIVLSKGMNGSTNYSILDSKGGKIVANKGLNIIAEEIKIRYPEISRKIVIASVAFEVDSVNEIDLSKLQPEAKYNLIKIIVEISSK